MNLFTRNKPKEPVLDAVTLDLSATHIDHAFESLLNGSESQGGIERFAHALQKRRDAFQEVFDFTNPAVPNMAMLQALCAFMPTVRRRIAPYLENTEKSAVLIAALVALQDGAQDVTTTNARITTFCQAFPKDKDHRWVRDMACEILHGTDPERYPMMCRWVWDNTSNTGVLREIWFSDDIDKQVIDIADSYEAFLALRQELSQYLSKNGIYRDMLQMVDLLQAQIYAIYICDHGNTYIRADFTNPEDPMMHIRRLLGLDGVTAKGRSKLKTVEGHSVVFETINALS